MFFKDEGCKPLMQQLLREFIQHSFKLFESTPEQNFSNISDTMETFFGCLSQVVKKIPQVLEDKTLAYDRLVFYAQRDMTLPESGMYCYDVLNDYILEILAAMLDEAIADLQRHRTHWTKLEACIYSFQSVAEHFGGEESRQIPRLMRVLAEIPYEKLNVKLQDLCLFIVASFQTRCCAPTLEISKTVRFPVK